MLGGALVEFVGEDAEGKTRSTKQLCYVAKDIGNLYLSRTACEDLGLISQEFPSIGDFSKINVNSSNNKMFENYVVATNKCKKTEQGKCNCSLRKLPPQVPTKLPFPAVPENREKLRDWIISKYAASAFNQCEHQPLPLMKESPPIKLHIDPEAKPVAIHKARPIPIHWRESVKKELERDLRIGVLE